MFRKGTVHKLRNRSFVFSFFFMAEGGTLTRIGRLQKKKKMITEKSDLITPFSLIFFDFPFFFGPARRVIFFLHNAIFFDFPLQNKLFGKGRGGYAS